MILSATEELRAAVREVCAGAWDQIHNTSLKYIGICVGYKALYWLMQVVWFVWVFFKVIHLERAKKPILLTHSHVFIQISQMHLDPKQPDKFFNEKFL